VTEADRTGRCPDPEELAAFVEGRLRGEDRARVTAHLADCDECRHLFAQVARDLPVVVPFWKRRKVQAVGGGILALAASLIVVMQVRPELNPFRQPTPYEELVAAVGTNRTVEGRLSAFNYGPLRSLSRSGGTTESTDYELLAAAARIRARASERPTAENLRALGVAQLALGQHDEAIAVLEKGVDGPDAALYNTDLAVAYLERGRQKRNPDDYARALAAAERAIRRDPSLAEPYFNRALALEYLHLSESARKAWEEALQHDQKSGWADEIRSRARQPSKSSAMSRDEFMRAARASEWHAIRPVIQVDAQIAREIIEDELLPAWALAIIEDRGADAATELTLLHTLTMMATASHPDSLLRETVDHVEQAHGNRLQLLTLARGHAQYSRGREALRENRDAAAARSFALAARYLTRAGSPFHLWADFHGALIAYYQRRIDRANMLCKEIETIAEKRDHAALYGRLQWLRGLLAITVGRYRDALTHYQKALSVFERHGDQEHRAAVSYLLAEVHMNLGDRRAAWKRLEEALALRGNIRDPWRRHTLLQMGGILSNRTGLPEAALAFQDALVESAISGRNPAAQTEAYLQRAITFANIGAASEAASDIEAAHEASRTIPDVESRQAFETDIIAADGEVRLTLRDPEALRALDTAIPRLRRERHDSRLARLLLARARANLLNENEDAAATDLQEGIALVERLRAGLGPAHTTLRYGDRVWDLYDEMAALCIRRGRPDRALEYVDHARARSVVEGLGYTGQPRGLDREYLRQLIPQDAAILSYLVVDSIVGVWVMTPKASTWLELSVPPKHLRSEVATYIRALVGGDDQVIQKLAGTLYDRLLAPVELLTADARRLIVVPHDALNELPFSTLLDRTVGKYVVERHSIVVVPSLLAYCKLTERLRAFPAARSILAIGDPAISPGSRLPRLPHAAREALDVTQLYPRGAVLTGTDATRTSVVRLLATHDVFHFAGHAVASGELPHLSRLLIAPGQGDSDGAIYARDLWTLRLRNIQLVVLSACRTADGPNVRGEGSVTLSSAFLGAGVPRVIGTLWDVPDDASPHMNLVFHREFASGADHDVALRAAQLWLLRHPIASLRRPSVWGAFQSFGVTKSR
jgi:CHAT domain-containing protein/tetratricopeptide (TPR) repeat protein